MSVEQERLERLKAQIAALEPAARAIVGQTAANIELACSGAPRTLAMMALTLVTCEVVVALSNGEPQSSRPKLVVVQS